MKWAAVKEEGNRNNCIACYSYINNGQFLGSSFVYDRNLFPDLIDVISFCHRSGNAVGEFSGLIEESNEIDDWNRCCKNTDNNKPNTVTLFSFLWDTFLSLLYISLRRSILLIFYMWQLDLFRFVAELIIFDLFWFIYYYKTKAREGVKIFKI